MVLTVAPMAIELVASPCPKVITSGDMAGRCGDVVGRLAAERRPIGSRQGLRCARNPHVEGTFIARSNPGCGMVKSPGDECLCLRFAGHRGGETAHRMLSIVKFEGRGDRELKVFGDSVTEPRAEHGYTGAPHQHRFDAAVAGT